MNRGQNLSIRAARPSPRVTIPRVVAGLAPGSIDARRALTIIDAASAQTAYDLHRQAMAPSAPGPWDEAERRADFNKLLARVPSFLIEIDGAIAGYLQVLPRREVLHVVNIGHRKCVETKATARPSCVGYRHRPDRVTVGCT